MGHNHGENKTMTTIKLTNAIKVGGNTHNLIVRLDGTVTKAEHKRAVKALGGCWDQNLHLVYSESIRRYYVKYI